MSVTVTLRPDGTLDPAYSVVGAASSHAALSDNSDSSYINCALADNCEVTLNSFTLPAGAVTLDVTPRIRGQQNGTPDPGRFPQQMVAMYPGGYGSALGGQIAIGAFGASWTTLSGTTVAASLSQSQIDEFRVYIYQGDWGARSAELYVDIRYNPQPSAPTGVGPTGSVTTTLTPTFSWTHDASHATQSKRQVKVFTDTVHSGGGFNVDASQSVVNSTATTSSQSLVSPNTLTNSTTYWVYVKTAITTNGVDQWTNWSTGVSFTTAIDPGVPTGIVPASGASVATPYPNLDADGGSAIVNTKRQWQVASDSGFTSNAQIIDEGVFRSSHTAAGVYPSSGTALAQGTWYIRARFVDASGVTGSWTTAHTFTVAHAPSSTPINPVGGQAVGYATSVYLDWTFSDPYGGDSQTAYQIEMWKASDKPGTVIDTGKVSSTNTFATVGTVDATWKNVDLRWRVRVYDQDDVVGAWSTETSFFLLDLPVVTITAPTNGGTVLEADPTITWTFSSLGGVQTDYRVIVTDTGTAAVVADSGWLVGADLSWQLPSPVIQLSTNYSVQVQATDASDLTGSDTNNFTATYVAPTAPTVAIDTAHFESLFRVDLNWSTSTVDVDNTGWRVYRRLFGQNSWTLIYDGGEIPAVKTYGDFTAPANQVSEYAVIQVIDDGFGGLGESSYAPIQVNLVGMASSYAVVVPDDPSLNVPLYHVTSDSFSDEHEMSMQQILGKGRKPSYGTRFGQVGSLSALLRDNDEMTARQQRLWIEAIRNSGLPTYLRTPFGDVWKVALLGVSASRIAGLGVQSEANITIEYSEISA